MAQKTLTIALMDPPYESATTTTALRIADAALAKGINVNIFAYEGAVLMTMRGQAPHPNPVKGTTVEEQQHPTTAAFVGALLEQGGGGGGGGEPRFQWMNCGMCVDERGAGDWIEGVTRGGPGDFYRWSQESDSTLVIGTR
jgi:tRNA 2-thiouridine synthesizing protein D